MELFITHCQGYNLQKSIPILNTESLILKWSTKLRNITFSIKELLSHPAGNFIHCWVRCVEPSTGQAIQHQSLQHKNVLMLSLVRVTRLQYRKKVYTLMIIENCRVRIVCVRNNCGWTGIPDVSGANGSVILQSFFAISRSQLAPNGARVAQCSRLYARVSNAQGSIPSPCGEYYSESVGVVNPLDVTKFWFSFVATNIP